MYLHIVLLYGRRVFPASGANLWNELLHSDITFAPSLCLNTFLFCCSLPRLTNLTRLHIKRRRTSVDYYTGVLRRLICTKLFSSGAPTTLPKLLSRLGRGAPSPFPSRRRLQPLDLGTFGASLLTLSIQIHGYATTRFAPTTKAFCLRHCNIQKLQD